MHQMPNGVKPRSGPTHVGGGQPPISSPLARQPWQPKVYGPPGPAGMPPQGVPKRGAPASHSSPWRT
ncbi:hypothetical protein CVS40_9838 [Lucilia cuprina]|nr:hypothetical protein CVS40_9838 [Lucilia cuprina]